MKINKKICALLAFLLCGISVKSYAAGGTVSVARAFYELARQNNVEKIETLLQRGYSVESVDERGLNAVCLSVVRQDKKAYNVLTAYGANATPACLKKVPDSSYRRFFGISAEQSAVKEYTPDEPYLLGTAALAASAITAAYIFRGDTDGSSGGEEEGGEGGGDEGEGGGDEGEGGGDEGEGGGDEPEPIPECPANSHWDEASEQCLCDPGFDHYGSETGCYPPIANCEEGGQYADTCPDNCVPGYGNHGDIRRCYLNIEHCADQDRNSCRRCEDGYDTFGNPSKCYSTKTCEQYPNSIPTDDGTCVCNEYRGYHGDPYNGGCSQTDGGDYQEGDETIEEWNNYNELYCNSHGHYDIELKTCSYCYTGYKGADCSECAENYLNFGGLCFADLQCGNNPHQTQENGKCVCDEGYVTYYNDETQTLQCLEPMECPLHYEQYGTECVCKSGFDENCECPEEEGYTYYPDSDTCIRTSYVCEEKWTGPNCDICPIEYEITIDSDGAHCGNKCAPNRAPIEQNEDCTECGVGYQFSPTDNNCIRVDCLDENNQVIEGYLYDDKTKQCTCDTENGWRMGVSGVCEQRADDLIGMYNSNINNSTITVENDGILRDIYGMKPYESMDEEGNITYYGSVYNGLTTAGSNEGNINITNKNTGGNFVYGIYSQSDIYNAAVIHNGTEECLGCNNYATGKINIKDVNTGSTIYGMYNSSENDIYNAFTYATGDGKTMNVSTGEINISKETEEGGAVSGSTGKIVGIEGGGNIYNAYSNSIGGVNVNSLATGSINITHAGTGDITGISGTNSTGKINNALAYLDSPVSNIVASGSIVLNGNGNVFGISGNGTITNSETQFKKYYYSIGDFYSEGTIDVTSNSEMSSAIGIYSSGSNNTKTSIYNAKGYNATGNIIAKNTNGGSAYGIYSAQQTYNAEDEKKDMGIYYNNTYNAFRSSQVYGDGVALGNIEVSIEGYSNLTQQVTGIFAAGNVYNAYANSGSDVKLETIGNINVTDNSTVSMVNLRGIESNGATIANAYSTGQNENTATVVTGNITVTNTETKNGYSTAAGIWTDSINPQGTQLYNAALVNDKNTVEGNITVESTRGRAPNLMYGIYATSHRVDEDESEAQPKTVYNAFYYNEKEGDTAGNVSGTINVTASTQSAMSNGQYYGIYVDNGKAYNAYSSSANANVIGTINVDAYGGSNEGVVAGMYGNMAYLDNSGTGSSINVTSRGNGIAYGMKGDNAQIRNDAEINVESTGGADAYGIYIDKGSVVNDVNGVINVSGTGNNYGIYAISDGTPAGTTSVENRGKINLNGEKENIGIYASGATATVSNSGTITINGEECSGGDCNNGTAIKLENGAVFNNSGEVVSESAINFDAWGENVVLNTGGSFESEDDISGTLKVSSDVVKDTFSTSSSVENALSAESIDDVELKSNSYLYTASAEENADGKYDVVMNMKGFDEVTDADKASYLAMNYQYAQNSDLYNALKSASTKSEYDQREADILGTSVLPNIAQENLKVQRSLDRAMMSELFTKENKDVRKMVGADGIYIGRDDHGTLSGYDIMSQSMYALYDKRLNNKYRLGAGISFTHIDTDYNNDSSRKSFMVQGYVPLTYTNANGITAVSMARLGFADGDYRRRGYEKTYEADTTEITYGWLNELRYTMNLGAVNLTPFIGFNATGWYQDAMDEGDDSLALRVDSTHIFSLESALGLYLDKDIEFSEDNRLNVALGIGYYHEFADPYRGMDAHINDTFGNYKLRDIEHINSRDRGILSARINYDYKDFSVYGELLQYLEKEYPIKVDVGLKYNF